MSKNDAEKTQGEKQGEKQEAEKGVWYMLSRNLANYVLQRQCQAIKHNPVTGLRETDDEHPHKDVEFQDGLFYTEDKAEQDFLDKHLLASDAAPPAVSFRRCTQQEVSWINDLKSNGQPRSTWHGRLKAIENALGAANAVAP